MLLRIGLLRLLKIGFSEYLASMNCLHAKSEFWILLFLRDGTALNLTIWEGPFLLYEIALIYVVMLSSLYNHGVFCFLIIIFDNPW